MRPIFSMLSLRRLRRFPLAWWAVVVILAVGAGTAVTTTVSRSQTAAARYGGLVTVSVTTRPLVVGAVVSAGDVEQRQWPRAFLPQSPVVDRPVGQVVIAPLAASEPVVANALANSGLSGAAALLHAGEVAIAVPKTAATPDLATGQWVNVMGTFDVKDGNGGADPTIVVCPGARVVNVSDGAVTVAVPADLAPKVAFTVAKGIVTLGLVSPSAG